MYRQHPLLFEFLHQATRFSWCVGRRLLKLYRHQPPHVRLGVAMLLGILVLFFAAEPRSAHSKVPDLAAGNRAGVPASFEQALQPEIDAWLGTPYAAGGSSRSGTDCSGFVKRVYKSALNINLPRSGVAMYTQSRALPDSERCYGDLVFFSYGEGRISHVGIYVGHERFVHAANSGVQYDHLDEPFWAESYIGTRRPNQF